jgi:hypothetical protein
MFASPPKKFQRQVIVSCGFDDFDARDMCFPEKAAKLGALVRQEETFS